MAKKRSRLILVLAIVSAIIIILAFIAFTQLGSQAAQDAVPGVNVGDTFTYDIRGYYSSNDPNATIPENFPQINMTEWFRIVVTEVSGSEVTINTTWRFSNETELNGINTIDVETGINNPIDGFWAIYASNLRANDRTRPNGPDQSTINATSPKEYSSGVTRETNTLSLVQNYYDADDPTYGTTLTEYMQADFDKQTGMLVQLSDISDYTNPGMRLALLWTLMDTNVWAVS
jgi:hypothetical protein